MCILDIVSRLCKHRSKDACKSYLATTHTLDVFGFDFRYVLVSFFGSFGGAILMKKEIKDRSNFGTGFWTGFASILDSRRVPTHRGIAEKSGSWAPLGAQHVSFSFLWRFLDSLGGLLGLSWGYLDTIVKPFWCHFGLKLTYLRPRSFWIAFEVVSNFIFKYFQINRLLRAG